MKLSEQKLWQWQNLPVHLMVKVCVSSALPAHSVIDKVPKLFSLVSMLDVKIHLQRQWWSQI